MTNVSMNEMNTQNSAFDVDEQKLTDLEALDLVLQKPETRESFLKQIDVLVRQKESLLTSQDSYKDLISSTKEAFKFKTAKFITTTVDSIVKQKLQDDIDLAVAEADLLEIVKQHVEGQWLNIYLDNLIYYKQELYVYQEYIQTLRKTYNLPDCLPPLGMRKTTVETLEDLNRLYPNDVNILQRLVVELKKG